MHVLTSNGEFTTAFKGSVEEYQEYINITSNESIEESCEAAGGELFSVTFRDCDGNVSSQTLTGDDATWLENVLESFMKAYNRSGFLNDLEIKTTSGCKISICSNIDKEN